MSRPYPNPGPYSDRPVATRAQERCPWTKGEDEIIVQSVAELGHKWFEIGRRLPARQAARVRGARGRGPALA